MNKDALATPANRTRGHIFFFGAIAGLAVGCLDILGAGNGGKLERGFDAVDRPVILLIDAARNRSDGGRFEAGHVYDFHTGLAIICYWALIGLLVAALLSVVRASIINGVTWHRALILGAVAGMAVGGLNLAAAVHGSIREAFDVLDSPVISTLPPTLHNIPGLLLRFYSYGDVPYLRLAIFCYWTVIGLSLASLYYLSRSGVIRQIARDRISQRALFFGASLGMFIGGLNSLAMANGWAEWKRLFEALDRPGGGLRNFTAEMYQKLLPASPAMGIICLMVAAVVYWAIIGFFLAFIFCVVRMLVKRKATTKAQMPEE